MKSHKIMHSLAAFLMGLFLTLILLEAGLRIVGAVYHKEIVPVDLSSALYQKKSYTILCLGNSFTAGAEALEGQSYPDDLQRLLDKKFGEGKNRVINFGRVNQNTRELLDVLESFIRETNPNLILLQTGQPNWWNYYKYSDYSNRSRVNSEKPRFFTNNILFHSHTYRLFMSLCNDIINKRDAAEMHDYRTEGCPEIVRGACYKRHPDEEMVNKAIKCLKEQINLYPNDPEYYGMMGRIYQDQKKNQQEALKWYMKGLKTEGRGSGGQWNPSFLRIQKMRRAMAQRTGRPAEIMRKEIDRFIEEYEKENTEGSNNFMRLTDEEVSRWAESDIRDMVDIIRKKNIKLILQNYPFDPKNKSRAFPFINPLLRNIAKDLNVPFVDDAMLFKKMLDAGAKRDDYFAIAHCNARGYEMMAKNVYDKILEEKFVELNGQNN